MNHEVAAIQEKPACLGASLVTAVEGTDPWSLRKTDNSRCRPARWALLRAVEMTKKSANPDTSLMSRTTVSSPL